MSDICLNCQGLIMEPNVAYGYAGKACFCPIDPKKRYQRPSLNEKNKSIQSNKTPPPVSDERKKGVEWAMDILSLQPQTRVDVDDPRLPKSDTFYKLAKDWLEQQAKEQGIL